MSYKQLQIFRLDAIGGYLIIFGSFKNEDFLYYVPGEKQNQVHQELNRRFWETGQAIHNRNQKRRRKHFCQY